ncbi:MAG: NUDIX hydrolase [Treponema sp.]|nr:NUDIX hydrolase [Treponema sp.]
MDKQHLIWKEENRRNVLDCRIFSVWESNCKPPAEQHSKNMQRTFSIIEARDWTNVIPVINTPDGEKFIMVWQWRHGAKELSLEFPGGVFEPGEKPEQAAARELYEETGYKAGSLKKLGDFSPNPAIMSNRIHFFLAEDLKCEGRQELDEDEYVDVELINIEDVLQGMGKAPYINALMGSALSLYYQQKNTPEKK